MQIPFALNEKTTLWLKGKEARISADKTFERKWNLKSKWETNDLISELHKYRYQIDAERFALITKTVRRVHRGY